MCTARNVNISTAIETLFSSSNITTESKPQQHHKPRTNRANDKTIHVLHTKFARVACSYLPTNSSVFFMKTPQFTSLNNNYTKLYNYEFNQTSILNCIRTYWDLCKIFTQFCLSQNLLTLNEGQCLPHTCQNVSSEVFVNAPCLRKIDL